MRSRNIVNVLGFTGYSSCFVNHTEQVFQSLVSAMVEGALVHSQEGEIIAINPAAERILGIASTAILGQTCEARTRTCSIIHEDGSEFPSEFHPAMVTLRTGVPQSNVVMGITKPDGVIAWISINSRPLISNGVS